MSDKVTDINKYQKPTPTLNPLAAAILGNPVAYPGAEDAIRNVLRQNNFAANAVDKGWIELRIVAKFARDGALFHTVQARQVQLTEREQPSAEILHMIEFCDQAPPEAYLSVATDEEKALLDTRLSGLSTDQMLTIAQEIEGFEEILSGREGVIDTLAAIIDRAESAHQETDA